MATMLSLNAIRQLGIVLLDYCGLPIYTKYQSWKVKKGLRQSSGGRLNMHETETLLENRGLSWQLHMAKIESKVAEQRTEIQRQKSETTIVSGIEVRISEITC